MGTDYLQLLDRRTAKLIIGADESELISLIEMRTTSGGPPVWKSYWDSKLEKAVDFERTTSAAQRLEKIRNGSTLEDIKERLLYEISVSHNFLYLDYWGCWVEAFPIEGPPGAITWEDFTAPMRSAPKAKKEEWDTSGCYLLTDENVSAILRSLEVHRHELTNMREPEIDQLRRWQAFCRKHPEISILYQIDF
jgi:hypothetical protein